jgi:signal transduction histidine kinase
VNLSQLLDEVVGELTPLAQEKRLAMNRDFGDVSIPTIVSGDRLELHRLFTNLIGNAIKFTASGSVTVRIKTVTISPQPDFTDSSLLPTHSNYINVEIADTGPGIQLEEQATLFERFRQGNHKITGSGLGLYLSRRIVEAHQGNIIVNSDLGKGSVFTVSLPVKI